MQFYYAEDQFVLRHMKEGGKYIEPDERDLAFLIQQIHKRECTVNSPLATLKKMKETFRWKGMAGDVMRIVTHCNMVIIAIYSEIPNLRKADILNYMNTIKTFVRYLLN